MKKYYTLFCTLFCLGFSSVMFACTDSKMLTNIPQSYFQNYLGVYSINLAPTLAAIASGEADQGGDNIPYYAKQWTGSCPGGLEGEVGSCKEYTVYPTNQNFSPAGIMQKIEQYTSGGEPNRGEVRILTNASETQYVYTTDHEVEYCGPYNLS